MKTVENCVASARIADGEVARAKVRLDELKSEYQGLESEYGHLTLNAGRLWMAAQEASQKEAANESTDKE